MKKTNKVLVGILLVALATLGIFAVNKTITKTNNSGSEFADLRPDSIATVNIKPVINPDFSGIVFDQNQTVRLIHALNNGITLPESNPDQIFSVEIIITLTNGKQIIIGDSGEAEFLVTSNVRPNHKVFMMASTELKDLLLSYQDLFKREISLKKNIALYGTDRSTGIVLEDTPVREEAATSSEEIFVLQKGNLIRTLAQKTSQGVQWAFIDTVTFSLPNPVGWIESTRFTAAATTVIPNEGFLRQEVNLFSEPANNATVLQKVSGQLKIKERANGWARCSFPGGGNDGWVRDTDISYNFPADYNMGY